MPAQSASPPCKEYKVNPTCNPNNLQFYGLYLLIKGYLLLNCRLLEPQVNPSHLLQVPLQDFRC